MPQYICTAVGEDVYLQLLGRGDGVLGRGVPPDAGCQDPGAGGGGGGGDREDTAGGGGALGLQREQTVGGACCYGQRLSPCI